MKTATGRVVAAVTAIVCMLGLVACTSTSAAKLAVVNTHDDASNLQDPSTTSVTAGNGGLQQAARRASGELPTVSARVGEHHALRGLTCRGPGCVSDVTGKVGSGVDDFYKVSVTVTNNSDMTLVLTTAQAAHDNGEDGGGWGDRPKTSLAPGESDAVQVYSAVAGQGLSLVYHAQENNAKVKLVAQDPVAGSNNTNDTSAATPLTVTSSVGTGRQCTATFSIGGRW